MNKYANFTTWKQQEKAWLKDPAFRQAAQEVEPEYQLARSLIGRRLAKGITQTQLAKLAHTSQSAIARAEGGEHSVSLSFLKKLAQALGSQLSVSLK